MEESYNKYKVIIQESFSNSDITKLLLKDSINIFPPGVNIIFKNVENKVKSFFEEFDKLENPKKYKQLADWAKDISDWAHVFLTEPDNAEAFLLRYEMTKNLIRFQDEDLKDALYLDNITLYEKQSDFKLNKIQLDKLKQLLKNEGCETAKLEFILEIGRTNIDWYSEILIVFHKAKTFFISKFLPDLDKVLKKTHGEINQVEEIRKYVNSILELNLEKFRVNRTDLIDDVNDSIESAFTQCRMKSNATSDIEMDFCKGERNTLLKLKFNENKPKLNKSAMETDSYEDNPSSCSSVERNNNIEMTSSTRDSPRQFDDDENDDEDSETNEILDKDHFDKLLGKLIGKSATECLNFNINCNNKSIKSHDPLNMRNYQEELAKKGIEGKNVLICSPTGSGKTVVAVKIVEEHLRANPKGKVAFLVHRIALVEQQYEQFGRYLKCKITRISGSKYSGTPLIGHMKSFDLFILTSDILRNALEEKDETKLESINQFSLILFDECHNCDKKHPYNRIMTHYFKDKKAGKPVPQIIGLTASTGTDKARTLDKAMKRLFTLCANLDTFIVSTVVEFKEELDQIQSKPKEEILTPPSRPEDEFEKELQSQILYCERLLLEMNARDFFPKTPNIQSILKIPEDRLHNKYLSFVGKLRGEVYNVTIDDKDGKKNLFAIYSYLNAFTRALMVNHLFRAADAYELIKEILDLESKNPPVCAVEKLLKSKVSKLFRHAEDKRLRPNPSLEVLREKIENQIESDPRSRIIVFAKERPYTQILKSIFNSISDKIKCEIIVGNTVSAEQGGLTQNEMEEVLARFRRGDLNVLFATTVAEEGLDIQMCNLVIRYGHVTNETAMVQSRGRARAANSKYIVIVPHKLQWQVNKENINKYREDMMYKAIAKFQEMEESSIKKEIETCQCERELQETVDKIGTKMSREKQESQYIWDLFCKKCNKKICDSSDIRLCNGHNHIVINPECFDTMVPFLKENNNCQIKCEGCGSLLGNRQNYKNRYFPILTIDSFSLRCREEEEDDLKKRPARQCKKWKDVPFSVKELANKELVEYPLNHSLSI